MAKLKLSDAISSAEAMSYIKTVLDRADIIFRDTGGRTGGDPVFVGNVMQAFCEKPPNCDKTRSGFHFLHRTHGTRDYKGSDFAITMIAEKDGEHVVKTAMFQAKLVRGDDKLTMQESHLNKMKGGSAKGRSFGFCFDRKTKGARVHPAATLQAKSDLQNWESINGWVAKWLECIEGIPSKYGDYNGIEAELLRHFSKTEDIDGAARLLGFDPDRIRVRPYPKDLDDCQFIKVFKAEG